MSTTEELMFSAEVKYLAAGKKPNLQVTTHYQWEATEFTNG